jgi:membrane-bound ClpP family serine protease
MRTILTSIVLLVIGVITTIKEGYTEALALTVITGIALGVISVGAFVWAKLYHYNQARKGEFLQFDEMIGDKRKEIEWHEIAEYAKVQRCLLN